MDTKMRERREKREYLPGVPTTSIAGFSPLSTEGGVRGLEDSTGEEWKWCPKVSKSSHSRRSSCLS
jgi:hypothetical protein